MRDDEQARADAEEDVVLAAAQEDVGRPVAEHAIQLHQRLLREQDLGLALCPVPLGHLARRRHERQAVAVGGDKAHLRVRQHQQRAVEEVARVFAGDRKARLRDHLPQAGRGQDLGGRRPLAERRQLRVVVGRLRRHPRLEPVGGDLHAAAIRFDPHVGVGQLAHEFKQLLGWQRQRAALRHRCRALRPEAHVEVRRHHPHRVAVGLDQDVGQHRDRDLPLDDVLEE
jgi:hypothetical protein